MSEPQQILYDLALPEFLSNFRDVCLGQLIRPIDFAIQVIQNSTDPVLYLLCIIIFAQLLRIAMVQNQNSSEEGNSVENKTAELYAMMKEVNDLKRQIKGIKKTVEQIKTDGLGGVSEGNSASSSNNVALSKIMEYCRDSWTKREEIADHIIDYQTKLLGEVKKMKSKHRTSPSKLKTSNSAISDLKNK